MLDIRDYAAGSRGQGLRAEGLVRRWKINGLGIWEYAFLLLEVLGFGPLFYLFWGSRYGRAIKVWGARLLCSPEL